MLSYNNSLMVETKEDILKCPHCKRTAVNGISDFYSLVEGSTAVKKTCRKCRIETYKCYKKNNPTKYKNKEKFTADELKKQVEEHKRCPQCSRKTMGIVDYKHFKNDSICKNCKRCRLSVLNCYRKNKPITTPTEELEDKNI